MSIRHPEAATRTVVAEAIAEWAVAQGLTPEELHGVDGVRRSEISRAARQDHPTLSARYGYLPSDATWDLAMRLMVIQPAAIADDPDDDPFAGFPR